MKEYTVKMLEKEMEQRILNARDKTERAAQMDEDAAALRKSAKYDMEFAADIKSMISR